MIQTSHIVAMLDTAARYAEAVGGKDEREPITLAGEVAHYREPHQVLERASNLAAHAAQELMDEALRARDGWPVV